MYAGEPLPQSVDGIDLLVVMGGPQSPTTSLAECPHFDSAAEQVLIRRCAQAGKAVVGVCLGAQLIGAMNEKLFGFLDRLMADYHASQIDRIGAIN